MSKRTGKFIGAYIKGDIKRKLEREAKAQDRPLSYIIEKILTEGVKHLSAEGPELKQAA